MEELGLSKPEEPPTKRNKTEGGAGGGASSSRGTGAMRSGGSRAEAAGAVAENAGPEKKPDGKGGKYGKIDERWKSRESICNALTNNRN